VYLCTQIPSCFLIMRKVVIHTRLKIMADRIEIPHIRFTEDEVKGLKEKFKKSGFSSFSAFIRYLIFSKKVNISFSPTDERLARAIVERNVLLKELNMQLNKIGVNINQVAKKVNSQQYVMREDLNVLQEEYNRLESRVNELLEQVKQNIKMND